MQNNSKEKQHFLENNTFLHNELFQLTKLSGMNGANNKYIHHIDLVKESSSMLGLLPEFATKEGYLAYMDKQALEKGFYEHLARKYTITTEQARDRFLSYSNLFNLLFAYQTVV